ncbi:MAG: hypothetical protein JW908_08775 [Anaerolineales bacterium]|nr:hypothetical protein [Anaerolineales bacterium]
MVQPFVTSPQGHPESKSVACPQCNHSVLQNARYCSNCGVDLALAAVFAEREVKFAESIPPGMPVAPEILLPRMGDYLIEQGVLTPEQLAHALNYQEEKAQSGQPVLLGQALRDLNYLDAETLDKVVTTQILNLQNALKEANRQLEARVQERTQDLQIALKRLTELNQLKANFIASISHELRTPLTLIKGYLDIFKDGGFGPLNREQEEALNNILKGESRLEKLIEDLIEFSLAARGQLSLNIQNSYLNGIFDEVVGNARHKAQVAQVSIETIIPPHLPPVSCDKEKISWVIAQLLDNAIKFSKKGGHIRLETRLENGEINIAVTDTGIGIPESRMKELFEPFHQLDSSSTRRYGGTGLGLALSNRIIYAHNSQIKVRSKEGKGSRFEFSLTLANQQKRT